MCHCLSLLSQNRALCSDRNNYRCTYIRAQWSFATDGVSLRAFREGALDGDRSLSVRLDVTREKEDKDSRPSFINCVKTSGNRYTFVELS